VLFEAPELDITQEVIKRLDVKLPQVQLATPQEPGLATSPARPPTPGPASRPQPSH
jgi:hypothetical protein